MKVPRKQPKRGRLWLNDGSCVRLRPEHRNHVWSYDFVMARTSNGRPLRMLNIIDGIYKRVPVYQGGQENNSPGLLEELFDLIVEKGPPDHIRSDNGPEFTAKVVREWLNRIGVKTLFIEPGITSVRIVH